MPEITRTALMRAAGVEAGAFDRHLADLALRKRELTGLTIAVTYVASLRDEIIPQCEWRDAAGIAPGLRVHVFDDVHGAPHHLRDTRLLILAELLRHAGRVRLARWIERVLLWRLRTIPHHSQLS
jgi:hypothetical protein